MQEFLDAPSQKEGPETQAAKEQRTLPLLPESTPPARADRPNWSFRDTMVGALLTLVPWLGLASLTLLTSSAQPAASQPLSPTTDRIDGIITLLLQVLLEGTFLIAPLWFAVFKPRRVARANRLPDPGLRSGFAALGFRDFGWWQALVGLTLGLLVIFATSALYAAITQALHLSVQTNVDVLQARAAAEPWTTLAVAVGAVAVAPVCEEVFFRGYFFQGLRLRINIWAAVILSAVVFGIAHGDLGSLALLIVIGLLLALLRWQTRSIWPGIFLHMLNNALGVIIIIQALRFH